MLKRNATLCASAVLLLALAGCASTEPPPKPEMTKVNAVQTEATVTAIDQKKRMVTLKFEDGHSTTFKAGPEVRNLAQVRKGDTVRTSYYESLAVRVEKAAPGAKPSEKVTSDTARAPLGEMPAGVITNYVDVTAQVTALDRSRAVATLKGPRGNLVDVKVRDPSTLDNVKVGDMVNVTYTESLAIEVERTAKK